MASRAQAFVLNILNIRRQETGVLTSMMAHAFFNGLGIALSFIAIQNLIVYNHGVSVLPWIYVAAGALLLTGGLVYSRLEHRFPPRRLFLMVLLFCTLWGVFARFSLAWGNSLPLIGLIFSTYYLVYMLSNLEFWGVASLLFDIRQGKRLFGPLSVGESVAKLIGYGSVAFITKLFSVADALMVAGLCFLISYLILRRLSKAKRQQFESEEEHHEDESPTTFMSLGLTRIFNNLGRDHFARSIGLFAMLGVFIYTTIQFGFLDRVEDRFESMEDIAYFFSLFYTGAKAINLIIKLLLSSRILNYFGLKVGLLILPITILLISMSGLIGFFNFTPGLYFFIIVFGLLYLAGETLQTSIYTPSYLLLFQPLAKNKRLEGHTLTKGIMEPIGMGLAGLGIILLRYAELFTLSNLIVYILIFAAIWLLSSFKLIREYLTLLKRALKSRLLGRIRFSLSRDEIDKLRDEKLQTEDPYELVYVTRLLGNNLSREEWEDVCRRLLRLEEPSILLEAFAFIEEQKLHSFEDQLHGFIFSNDPRISKGAANSYAALREEESVSRLVKDLERADRAQRFAIIGALLKNTGLYGAVSIGQDFLRLISSEREDDRINAARIIGDIENDKYYHPLIILLGDDSMEVRKAALGAAGKVRSAKLVGPVLDQLSHRQLFPYCLRAMEEFGPGIIPQLKLRMNTAGRLLKKSMIRLCAHIPSPSSAALLLEFLPSSDHALRQAAITSLFAQKFEGGDKYEQMLKIELDDNIQAMKKILSICKRDHSDGLLQKAVDNELRHVLMPQTLRLLSFLYGHKPIRTIMENMRLAGGDFRSNALELLENLLKRHHSRALVPFVEEILLLQADARRTGHKCSPQEVLTGLRPLRSSLVSDWLMGICVRVARKHQVRGFDDWFAQHTDNKILAQELHLYYENEKP